MSFPDYSKYKIDSAKLNGTVEERIEAFDKLGIPYVSFEHEKPDGNKMKVVIRTDMVRRL